MGPGGQPVDHVFSRFVGTILPFWMLEAELMKACSEKFNHEHYGLKTTHRVLAQHPTLSDDLPGILISL